MSARFVKLTNLGGDPIMIWFGPGFIVEAETTGSRILAANGAEDAYWRVRESPAEILALLAEPAPSPSVEVTEAAVEAANDAWFADVPWRGQGSERDCRMIMRAAIEAADRARGLRP